MMRLIPSLLRFAAILSGAAVAVPEDRYIPAATPDDPGTVLWSSSSADARGSMPAGNGDIGLNAWVEPSGDVCFFISKTDAWDENLRLLKLNKVRIKLTPALTVGTGFQQELKLREGAIEIRDARAMIRIWVDANQPVLQVDFRSLDGQPLAASATLEPWRLTQQNMTGEEPSATGSTTLPAISYPDITLPRTANRLAWYHRNVVSPWLPSMQLQKLDAIAATQTDPLLNLTMGGMVKGENWVPVTDL
jgi:alpha-L-fucosidase 2